MEHCATPATSPLRELFHKGQLWAWHKSTAISGSVGASGTTGTQERRGWHRLNGCVAGGDTRVVAIGRYWPNIIMSICKLRHRGVKIPSLAHAEKEWTRHLN